MFPPNSTRSIIADYAQRTGNVLTAMAMLRTLRQIEALPCTTDSDDR